MDAQATATAILSNAQQREITAPNAGTTRTEAKKAAEDFEAVFLSEMLGNMFAGIKTDGPFGGGHGESVMRSLLTDEYAKSITARGGIGIADHVYRELIRIQETQNAKPSGN